MLISEPQVLAPNMILDVLSGGRKGREVQTGIYKVHHFGMSPWLRGYRDTLGDLGLPVWPYGVCDSAENLLEKCPELVASERQFVVVLTPVRKADQEPRGGWRWHKWGDYIGAQTPTTEYLFDEPVVEQVFCYHIYERLPAVTGTASCGTFLKRARQGHR